MSDFHLRTLGRVEFLMSVKKAMARHGKVEWLRQYESKFGWSRRGFTWGEWLNRKKKRCLAVRS